MQYITEENPTYLLQIVNDFINKRWRQFAKELVFFHKEKIFYKTFLPMKVREENQMDK